ncbi:MAG: hypothetical protein HYX65_03655 [Gemmatimonadetes bacterium]|nr:hypothetical protein [Gemmatimonadota bacterium]
MNGGAEPAARPEPDARERAYASGFEAGRVEGERAEQARLRLALQAAVDAVEALRANEAQWTGAIEENIAALSGAIARHLVDREIKADDTSVARLVRRALDAFPIDQPVRIRVHPSDLATISTQPDAGECALAGAPTREAHWLGDPRIAPGGCLVEGRDRIVDGRVETALERVYRRLTYQDA